MKKKTATNKIICFKCTREILKKSNYVSLITHDNENIIERADFHISCWGEFNSQKVQEEILKYTKLGENLLKNAGLFNG